MTATPKLTDTDGQPLRDDPQEAEAYREIVLRYGTKVTLEQVMDTLREIGWTPPQRQPANRAPKTVLKVEDCETCLARVNPANASGLCRLPTHMCPYKAARAR